MKIYTIAEETHECYGHGDYGNELRICRQGSYGTGDFPPAFTTRDAAEKYLDRMERKHCMQIVELTLCE